MIDAIATALSGLTAQKTRLAASANNIANVLTGGRLPDATNQTSTVYKPLQTILTSLSDGGVQAHVVADEKGYTPSFDPTSAYANSAGLVAVPNVDLATEAVNITESKLAFKADLAVIKTSNEMTKSLLDIII